MPIKNLKKRNCKVCKKEFQPTNGNHRICFDCVKKYNYEYRKNWVKNNPEKTLKSLNKYRNNNREKLRKKDSEYKKKWRKENPELSLKKGRDWRKNNPERRNELQRIWARKNREYVYFMNRQRRTAHRNAEGTHTLKEWQNLKKKYKYTCPSCMLTEPDIVLEEDHIIPLSKEGTNYIENIQPLCGKCNRIKYTKVEIYGIPNIM